ncbi:MAG: DUF2461 domain-containing protein [Flavobacteriaceae bacterium]|nr:DUF2461 domain-containing protein [Flavobacteriaceae bacterium]
MHISKDTFDFLARLKKNNSREWMQDHKKEYQRNEKSLKKFYEEVEAELDQFDKIAKTKVFRIHRDVRFSKDKTPYNVHRSVLFSRAGENRRGSYYLRLEPGASLMAGGFFKPEPADLKRIRKEFEMDASEIRTIMANEEFSGVFGGFNNENAVKTAPKGFDKEDPNIDLIRLKSFYFSHNYTDDEVHASDFKDRLVYHYKLLQPFLNYMTEVLTTDLNGVSLLSDRS